MKKRREFIQTMLGLTAGMMLPVRSFGNLTASDQWGEILPQRKLGNTGESVTMLGVGGYHVGWTTERDAQEVIEAAIEGGIRFFDTAESYANGESERRYGKYLTPKYRDDIFLMTKTFTQDAKTAREHLEGSLRRLNTDHLDLWQIHSLQSPEDVDTRIANGLLDVVREAKESGKARHIGFTGHQNPYAHLRMLERTGGMELFSTCQFPVNLIDFASEHSFVRKVIPQAIDNNLAILAMKTLADGRFFGTKVMEGKEIWKSDDSVIPGRLSIREALFFSWSMPISVLITGAENAGFIKEKIALAKAFKEMNEATREKLANKVADLAEEGKVEYYKKV